MLSTKLFVQGKLDDLSTTIPFVNINIQVQYKNVDILLLSKLFGKLYNHFVVVNRNASGSERTEPFYDNDWFPEAICDIRKCIENVVTTA